ncbi:hypothetical protein GCM10026983_14460 [Gracilibacillus alcaliphilus]
MQSKLFIRSKTESWSEEQKRRTIHLSESYVVEQDTAQKNGSSYSIVKQDTVKIRHTTYRKQLHKREKKVHLI